MALSAQICLFKEPHPPTPSPHLRIVVAAAGVLVNLPLPSCVAEHQGWEAGHAGLTLAGTDPIRQLPTVEQPVRDGRQAWVTPADRTIEIFEYKSNNDKYNKYKYKLYIAQID